ncbi:glycosyltransferase family 4 protein [Candidatus Falkowbacteria bacterium]|jgi:glycosyltransferase involved in cell wall biosynthesis|nr:glycosyltransferase family 4 protein [Candidatus Falkowbacteria bacterium]MBT4433226.1 glycosyltransferase family 4 protein [Candidatus Falkowbacteria bacterium]
MRIAEVVCTFPPYKGGTGQVALDNSKILSKTGHEVVVFTPWLSTRGGSAPGGEKNDKFSFKVKRLTSIFKYGNAAILPQLFWQLKNFDIVHLHLPFYGTAEIVWFMKKIGVLKSKIIVTYHQDALGDGLKGNFFNFYNRYLMPRILNSADRIIVSSFDYIENSKIKSVLQKYKDKFVEMPFGVDLDFFKLREKSKSLMKKYNISKQEKIILFIGGLDKAHYFKGVNNLIKAFYKVLKSFPDARLVIIGSGDLKFEYEQIAFNFGLRDKVIFTGRINDNEKKKFLNLANLFVLPSINMGEAFGIVLLEAFASGVPAIASNLPGVRSVIDNSVNGFLVEPSNTEDLKEKIEQILSNDELKDKMGEEGRKKAEKKYNEKDINNKFIKIFEKL